MWYITQPVLLHVPLENVIASKEKKKKRSTPKLYHNSSNTSLINFKVFPKAIEEIKQTGKEEVTTYHVIPEIFPTKGSYSCLMWRNKILLSLDNYKSQVLPRGLTSDRRIPPTHVQFHTGILLPLPNRKILVLLSDTWQDPRIPETHYFHHSVIHVLGHITTSLRKVRLSHSL